jgi:predicted nucleotidyltransferase
MVETWAIQAAVEAWATPRPLVSRVWLFGSRAKGTHRPDSDVDLAIELDPALTRGCAFTSWSFDLEPILAELESAVPAVLDLQLYHDPETPNVVQYVSESGILLFAKRQ